MATDAATIRERILGFFPNTYDKTEGTVLWDLAQAYALDFETEYKSVDSLKTDFFLATVTGEDSFDNKIADYGQTRKAATYATGEITLGGTSGITIAKGSLIASDTAEYEILTAGTIPESGSINLPIQCTTAGTVGNCSIGSINSFPLSITGISSCYNNSAITNAVDEETIETARTRVQDYLKNPRTSGNVSDYKAWAEEVDTVGTARAIERWNGINTVKVLVTDRNNSTATDDIITAVAENIKNNRPIGAKVTVTSANLKIVDVIITGLVIDTTENQTVEQTRLNIKSTLKNYINSVTLNEEYISYSKCNSELLNTNGVGDFVSLTLNGTSGTLSLANDEIPSFGTVTIDGVVVA